jgi:hypothetical protein
MTNKFGKDVQVIDRGWDSIIADMRDLGQSYTKVGLPNDGTTKGRYDMAALIEVGAANEFGHGVPERPFMRNTFDENKQNIVRMQKEACEKVIDKSSTPGKALFEIGEEVVEMIKQKIMNGPFTENAKSTKARKGDLPPLIETMQLLNSIQHKEVFVR